MDTLGLGAHWRVRVCPNPLHSWEQYDWTRARKTGIIWQRCSDGEPPPPGFAEAQVASRFPLLDLGHKGPPTGIREPRVDAAARPSQVASSWQVRGLRDQMPLKQPVLKGPQEILGHAKPCLSCASGSWARPSPPVAGLPVVPHGCLTVHRVKGQPLPTSPHPNPGVHPSPSPRRKPDTLTSSCQVSPSSPARPVYMACPPGVCAASTLQAGRQRPCPWPPPPSLCLTTLGLDSLHPRGFLPPPMVTCPQSDMPPPMCALSTVPPPTPKSCPPPLPC